MSNQTKSLQVTKTIEIVLTSAGPEYSLDNSQWAINWFDLKSKWLYDVYNLLAFPHLRRAGGRLYYKGRLIKRLLGEESDERKMILIVNYPNCQSFLDMIRNRKFQLKSLVREVAVKHFTFGFTQRTDTDERPTSKPDKYHGDMKYMVHHFKNNHQTVDIPAIKSKVEAQGIRLHFSGIKSASLGSKKSGGETKSAPFLMDSIFVFESAETKNFDALINSESYQNFFNQNQSNYVGVFGREL